MLHVFPQLETSIHTGFAIFQLPWLITEGYPSVYYFIGKLVNNYYRYGKDIQKIFRWAVKSTKKTRKAFLSRPFANSATGDAWKTTTRINHAFHCENLCGPSNMGVEQYQLSPKMNRWTSPWVDYSIHFWDVHQGYPVLTHSNIMEWPAWLIWVNFITIITTSRGDRAP